jgi:hypothetical protein
VTRAASGTAGIPAQQGDFYGEAADGAFTRWGGYSPLFPSGGYTTSLAIYLDVDADVADDTRFDWSSAVSTPECGFRRDFVFNVGFYTGTQTCAIGTGRRFVISASNNASRSGANPCNAGQEPITVATTGWYTFTQRFADSGGVLDATLTVQGAGVTQSWTLSDPSDVIGSTVGGNRYGWFVIQEFPLLGIDSSARQ